MLNHIVIMGRLTRDPELRHTQSDNAVTSFTLAVDRDYAPKNGDKETDFIDIVAWRSTAEFVCKYFAKGRMAIVSGRLQIRPWEDRDGNKRKTAEIVADNVYFGDRKKTDEGSGGSTYAQKGYSSGGGHPASGGYQASSNRPASGPPAYSNGPAGDSGDFEGLGEVDDGDLPF